MAVIRKVPELERLASEMIGDAGLPDVFFVTRQGLVQIVALRFRVTAED